MSFGALASFLNYYVNGTIVKESIGKDYIGKKLTVMFQGYSDKEKIPRFPRGKTIRDKT